MGMKISGCMLPRKVVDVVGHEPSPYVPLVRVAFYASPNCIKTYSADQHTGTQPKGLRRCGTSRR